MSCPEKPSLSGLSRGELEALIERLLAERAEIAQLKGVSGKPAVKPPAKPSGMEAKTAPAQPRRRRGRAGKVSERVLREDRLLPVRHKAANGVCTQIGDDRFERIFARRTGFSTLDRLLARPRANKAERLRVLERPDIPLHTNGSESDIRPHVTRSHVTRRKVSGGTPSDLGRDARDGFLGLMKTCAKLGIAFWDVLGHRLGVPEGPYVECLPDIIRQRAA